ncbi:MAG: ubiquitin family protein [Barrevirus sp.]|uniref:Ubiquitin family protein n=1 Tax=Barrevirus sp. TaxID=2487763 RepID=A0A3G4ZQY7_9VIRU|nr:MAG: ubiquitin family protein [Barrevirus sp.]
MLQIKIKTLKGEITELSVPDNSTLQQLKEKVSELKSQPVSHVNIIFNGAILGPDDKLLTDLSLKTDSTVVLLIKPPKVIAVKQEIKEEVVAPPPPAPVQPGPGPGQAHASMEQAFETALQQNPQMFMQMMMADPQIQAMANADPQGFMNLISSPDFINQVVQHGHNQHPEDFDQNEDEGGEVYQQYVGNPETVALTDQQLQEVNEITNMGLGDYPTILQYYVAFNHDKVATVNHLLNEQLDGHNN